MRNLITMVTFLTLLGGRTTIAQTKGSAGSSAAPANQIVYSLRTQDTRLIGGAPVGHRERHADDVPSENPSDLEHVGAAKELGYPHELWTTRLLARHARDHGPAEGHLCLANTKMAVARVI
jgi:hypothetical protein